MYKKTFHGGVHPYDGKEFARDIPFQTWLPKGDLVFHLNQHIGKPAKPLVQKGDSVLGLVCGMPKLQSILWGISWRKI